MQYIQAARSLNIELRPHYTSHHRHAILLARDIAHAGGRRLVVFGGDGTFNEVVNGIFAGDRLLNPQLQLIYIGAGSSCDFLKMFPEALPPLARLTSDKIHWVDVVKLQCHDATGRPLTRYFTVNSSLGIISRSIAIFNQNTYLQRYLKRRNIDWAVLYAGLKNILTFPSFRALVRSETESWDSTWKNITVFKSPYFGGGMHYDAATSADDGHLHLALIKKCSIGRTLFLLPALYQGTIFTKTEAVYRRVSRLDIDCASSRLWIETDGEIIGKPPATYTILTKALPVVI